MKCLEGEGASQRTGTVPCETQEEPCQEAPHRAQSPQVVQQIPQNRSSEKVRVQWPQADKTAVWQQFDKDADTVLEATAKGHVDWRLQMMTTIIVSLAAERFGAVENRPGRTPFTMN